LCVLLVKDILQTFTGDEDKCDREIAK